MKLPKCDLGLFGIDHAQVHVMEAEDCSGLDIRVYLKHHANASTGKPSNDVETILRETVSYELYRALPATAIRDFVRRLVLRALEHEVDEWLRIDGERVKDPHPELRPK